MCRLLFTYHLHVPAALGTRQHSTENALSSCSFTQPWAAVLSAKCQKKNRLSFFMASLYPTRKQKAVSPTCTSPFTKKSPCPLTHPPLRQATSPNAYQLSVGMEKPAAKATAATAGLTISRKGREA